MLRGSECYWRRQIYWQSAKTSIPQSQQSRETLDGDSAMKADTTTFCIEFSCTCDDLVWKITGRSLQVIWNRFRTGKLNQASWPVLKWRECVWRSSICTGKPRNLVVWSTGRSSRNCRIKHATLLQLHTGLMSMIYYWNFWNVVTQNRFTDQITTRELRCFNSPRIWSAVFWCSI